MTEKAQDGAGHQLDPATVAAVAQAATGSRQARVSSWDAQPIDWQAISSVTAGLLRVRGTADADGVVRTWSCVVKTIRPGRDFHGDDWAREARIYGSGILDRIDGISAPLCYRIEEQPMQIQLWLEEIIETGPEWPFERYLLSARHLGEFNGAESVRRAGDDMPWLRVDMLASWVRMLAGRIKRLDDEAVRTHVLVREALGELEPRLRAVHAAREELLDALDGLPSSFAHLDAWRANLMARDHGSRRETVAIDWGIAGLAPLGQELGISVSGDLVWGGPIAQRAHELSEQSFDAYVRGLRSAGWRGNIDVVRSAYAATFAIWVVSGAPAWLAAVANEQRRPMIERKMRAPVEEVTRGWRDLFALAVDLGEEARATMRR